MRRRRGPGAAFPRRRGCGRRWRIQMVAWGVAPEGSFPRYNAQMSRTSVALLFKTGYGARCMQAPIYSDMIFHDTGPSEDCLYLNLSMPAPPVQPKLAFMVWIY